MIARPLLTLLLLCTVLPELFSGSTPLAGFGQPGLVLFLALGYGVAILLIRELAVRYGASLAGLGCLGLAYSIFNEGLLAKTLLRADHLPVALYDNYGRCLGIMFPWAAGIGTWHACASVLFPILLVHHGFPGVQAKPWLRVRVTAGIGIGLVLLACAVFLGRSARAPAGAPTQLAVLLALIAGLLAAGTRLRGGLPLRSGPGTAGPFLLGLSVVIPFWGLGFLAQAHPPVAGFFLALALVVCLYRWCLRRRRWLGPPALLFFGLGWYLHNILQALVFIGLAAHEPRRALLTGLVDAAILLGLVRWVRHHESRLAGATTAAS